MKTSLDTEEMTLVRNGRLDVWKKQNGVLVFADGETVVAKTSSKGAGGCYDLTTFWTGAAKGGMTHTGTVEGVLEVVERGYFKAR